MRLHVCLDHAKGAAGAQSGHRRGTTLVEAMVTAAIIVLVLAAVLVAHLYGLRLYSLNRSKLESTRSSRELISHLVGEVYAAANIYVASEYTEPFLAITNSPAASPARMGNALQIWQNPTSYVCYYYVPGQGALRRKSSSSSQSDLLSDSVVNGSGTPVFSLCDYLGNVLSNETGNACVGLRLEFAATNFPSSQRMDYYKFETRISRRSQFQP